VSYESELRRTADEFTMTVLVIAEHNDSSPLAVAVEALRDSLARLSETGVIGGDEEAGGESPE
jgi:hypothetical protein